MEMKLCLRAIKNKPTKKKKAKSAKSEEKRIRTIT